MFVIAVTTTRSTPSASAQIARIWSPSTISPDASTASIRSPSPSNAIPRSYPPTPTAERSIARSVAPQPALMFVPSGAFASAVTSAPSRSNTPGAIAEYAPLAQSTAIRRPVRSEPKCSTTCSTYPPVASSASSTVPPPGPGCVEERLDLELVGIGELASRAVEDLDAVVLGRVVRGGDDEPEVLRQQRDGRRRQDAGKHCGPTRLDDPTHDGGLERRARATRVAPDEDAPPARTRASPHVRDARRDPPSATRRRCHGRRPCRTTASSACRRPGRARLSSRHGDLPPGHPPRTQRES